MQTSPPSTTLTHRIFRAHNFSRAVKSRLAEGLARQVDLFDIWQKSFTGLAENLTALRLIPFYFPTAPDLHVSPEIDAEPTIDALRGITYALLQQDPRRPQASHYVVYNALASNRSICDSDDSTKLQRLQEPERAIPGVHGGTRVLAITGPRCQQPRECKDWEATASFVVGRPLPPRPASTSTLS